MRYLLLVMLSFSLGCGAKAQAPATPPAPVQPASAEPAPPATEGPASHAQAQPEATPQPNHRASGEAKPSPQSGAAKREAAQPFADKSKKSRFRLEWPMDHVRRLTGKWIMEVKGQQPLEMMARRIAGGSGVIEYLFPNEDFDNASVYTAVDDDVVLTHFSYLNNAPRLRAKTKGEGWKPGELTFTLDADCGLRVQESGRYLKSIKIEFIDDDTLRYVMVYNVDGKDMAPAELVFKRNEPPAGTPGTPPPAPAAPTAPAAPAPGSAPAPAATEPAKPSEPKGT